MEGKDLSIPRYSLTTTPRSTTRVPVLRDRPPLRRELRVQSRENEKVGVRGLCQSHYPCPCESFGRGHPAQIPPVTPEVRTRSYRGLQNILRTKTVVLTQGHCGDGVDVGPTHTVSSRRGQRHSPTTVEGNAHTTHSHFPTVGTRPDPPCVTTMGVDEAGVTDPRFEERATGVDGVQHCTRHTSPTGSSS